MIEAVDSGIETFDESIEIALTYLTQTEGPLILIGVSDDTTLRDYFIEELTRRLPDEITLCNFVFDREHLSLYEGALEAAESAAGRVVVCCAGLEKLPRDKQSEAIKLLNAQRNRLGYARLAVFLWLNQSLYVEAANKSYDFYSWNSHTFFLEPPADWDRLASLRRSYLNALVAQNEYVNMQGLAPMRGGQYVQMRMDEIFIPLRVEEEVSPLLLDIPSGVGKTSAAFAWAVEKGTGASDDQFLGERPQERLVQRFGRLNRETGTRSVEISELLRHRRAVVLGDPGAGKTTMLRYVAYGLARSLLKGEHRESEQAGMPALPGEVADCLPVYVRIGLYAQHLQDNPDSDIADFAPRGCQMLQMPLSAELLKAEMERGRALFLLDGLDEIVDTSQRREVASRVTQFASKYPDCPVIVTSRIVGYREAQLGSQFTPFTVSPFGEEEINRFVEGWYRALDEPHRAKDLIETIARNDSVKRLASNPLLLTVIALIHRRAKLPDERVKLYQLAAETLTDQWMTERRVVPEAWDARETVRDLLPAVAWRMHRTTSSGLIGEQELHELLVETMRRLHTRLTENEAHTRAAQFRRNVAEFSGIFLERGLDQEGRGLYSFLHLTFEEYFAAVRLCELWEREGNDVLKPLMHDPRWNEIVLLAAGRLGDSSQFQATQFVRGILESGSEYEDVLRRDLFLAARCLGEGVRADRELREEIVDLLRKLYFDSKSPGSLREDIRKTFGLLGNTAARDDLVEALLERLSAADGAVRSAAARALGALGEKAAREEVIAALLERLSNAEWSVRYEAARALGALGEKAAREEVIAVLLERLSDADGFVRYEVARVLGALGEKAAREEVIAALLERLSAADGFVRSAAARALGALGEKAAREEVIAALLERLSDAEGFVRYEVARALGALGEKAAREEVIAALLERLSAADGAVRSAAVSALGALGEKAAREEVIAALLERLSDADGAVRYEAARALGALGEKAAREEVIAALLERLSDAEWSVRSAAARALGALGEKAAREEVIAALLERLSAADGSVRSAAARALGALGEKAAREEVIAALLERSSAADASVRYEAARALGALGEKAAREEVVAALLERLSDAEWSVRYEAARALGALGEKAAREEVIAALLESLSNAEWSVRDAAVSALGALASKVQPQSKPAFIKLVLPQARNKRRGDKNDGRREAGYVALRNLMAAEAD